MPTRFANRELDADQSTGWCKRRSVWCRRGVVAVLLLALLCPRPASAENTEEFPEYQLKAAFLFNFAKFIQWPDAAFNSTNAPIVIGVLGEDPFGALLKNTVDGKKINGRALEIKYFKRGETVSGCHVLFISQSEKESAATIIAGLKDKSILTVADFDGFARGGGMMNLIVVSKGVRFEINVEATERAGLKVSSKLGALGIVVKSEAPKGKK